LSCSDVEAHQYSFSVRRPDRGRTYFEQSVRRVRFKIEIAFMNEALRDPADEAGQERQESANIRPHRYLRSAERLSGRSQVDLSSPPDIELEPPGPRLHV